MAEMIVRRATQLKSRAEDMNCVDAASRLTAIVDRTNEAIESLKFMVFLGLTSLPFDNVLLVELEAFQAELRLIRKSLPS
jgi:hypothetical protein